MTPLAFHLLGRRTLLLLSLFSDRLHNIVNAQKHACGFDGRFDNLNLKDNFLSVISIS